ncbi:hypothetical protein ACFB49_31420 [Sphingomonas sp. DBB INV C78]|uniref:diguanylate cyclase domain-containing protein n=1 Tax=Sphingomonas sp. DBB INV C78 TaxID=3349434 RepID=UPI0036D366CB
MLDRASTLAAIGAWECDLATEALTWTTGVFDIFGLPRHEAVERPDIVEMYCEESREAMEWLRADALARRRGFTLDAQVARPDGHRRWMRLTATVSCRDGRTVKLYGLKQDITEERAKWEALRQLVDQDSVTGLASRRAFDSRFLDPPISGSDLWPLGALVLIDVDGVRLAHDTHGHAAGRACLEAVATRIATGFRDALMIARIRDDRFAVLTRAHRLVADLERGIDALFADLALPIYWDGALVHVHPTVGMALAENPFAYDAEAMLTAAEAALAAAKRQSGPANGIGFMTPASRPS